MLANCRTCYCELDGVFHEHDVVTCKNGHKTKVEYIKCRFCGLYSVLICWNGFCASCNRGLGEGKASYFC